MEVGLGLGSNLDDRIANLTAAKRGIAAIPGVEIVDASPLYETEPVGVKPEYADMAFINAVVIVSYPGSVDDLHLALLNLETELGRRRVEDKFAPRTLDIDVLYADDQVRNDRIKLPHPQCARRRFVLQPLCDVRPELVLPGFDQSVSQILSGLPDTEKVQRIDRPW